MLGRYRGEKRWGSPNTWANRIYKALGADHRKVAGCQESKAVEGYSADKLGYKTMLCGGE